MSIDGGSLTRDKVVEVIGRVLDKVGEAESTAKESLYKELVELHEIIDEARSEMAAARPGDIKGTHIPTATDELDAVIEATEEATSSIMDACEKIENACDEIEDEKTQIINDSVMDIYQACSFQDITGQRITKVVHSLAQIDLKVEKLLTIIGGAIANETEAEDEREGDDRLLNGPQMADQAISQGDIDKLLSEFD